MARKTTIKSTEISESKIRNVIWMLKVNKTKKECCEFLGINYNTKRLDSIITEFRDKEKTLSELKKKARSEQLNQTTISLIIKEYQNGESISSLANRLYLTPVRIKDVLLTNNIPIRARSKTAAAKIDHIKQDLDEKFVIGQKVFAAKVSSFATIMQIYDEDYIDFLSSGHLKSVELESWKTLKDEEEPIEGVHFESYYFFDNNLMIKRTALEMLIKKINTNLEKYSRESYLTYLEGSSQYFAEFQRKDLFPVVNN